MLIVKSLIKTMSALCAISLSAHADVWERPMSAPFPADNKPTTQRIELGKLLFFDKRLSITKDISCATCHKPEKGWTDGKAKAVGSNGQVGEMNTPTLINSAYQENYLWDGRKSSLEEQALEPISSKHEMNMPLDKMVQKISSLKGYKELFTNAYPKEEITKESIAKAIASFERTIISDDTLFDRWIQNRSDIPYPTDAVEGFTLFLGKGKCKSCHGTFNFSYGNFENVGLGDDPKDSEEEKNSIWYGAYKTPTLRDAEKTAPYFHDGSVHTLEEAVHICGNGGRYKDARKSPFLRDRNITTTEMYKIVAFIKTLNTIDNSFTAPTVFPE